LTRFIRSYVVCTGLACLFLPTACGGGNSSGSSSSSGGALPPSTTPTPVAVSTAASSSGTLGDCASGTSTQSIVMTKSIPSVAVTAVPNATYTLTSYPSGATITNNGSPLGTAPVSYKPGYTDTANFLTFTSGSSSFTMCLAQSGYPSRTILYNAAGDTSGSIGTVSTQGSARAVASIAQSVQPLTAVHHRLRHAPSDSTNSSMLLVKYNSSALTNSSHTTQSVEQGYGIRYARNIGPQSGSTFSRIVQVPSGTDAETLASTLAKDPTVVSVHPTHRRGALSLTPVTPNDTQFVKDETRQWDLYETQAPSAWSISEGSSSVAVAIIDTGYDPNNQDFAGKVTYSESIINGVTTSGSAAAQDTDGHGSNVAGIAAADTNNNAGVAGTGFNVALQIYRIFPNPGEAGYSADANGATSTDEAQAIYDAVAHGAKVISLSIGGTDSQGIDQSEYDAVEYAISQGVTVVSASGNERQSGVNTVDYPAAYPGVIAVGASALNDTNAPNVRSSATEYVASYSNSGPGLTLVAPGGDPNSTADADYLHWILNLDTTKPASGVACSDASNCIALFAGTSQATPHVSGTAALMYSINPSLTPAQVKSILMANADNINDARQGSGRLNMYRTLAAVAGVAPPSSPGNTNFVAFGYTNSGGTKPTIIDKTFTGGVPVSANGTFRLPDLDPNAGAYRIGIWADLNGNGIVDAGDYFGSSTTTCLATTACNTAASGISVGPVSSGFILP
jgi:subtilisin family serine protease